MSDFSPITQTFSVPFNHRVLFTDNVLTTEQHALDSLLERSHAEPPKVQFWIDEQVASARPTMMREIHEYLESRSGQHARPAGVFTCPGGESVKNDWAHVERFLSAINDADLDRRSYIVVIGGGAVLDAVGFAAATAHRGIRLIRIPTTTSAQADSGLGVKNAVNRFGKKNWLGTFSVPWGVINDAALITTLPTEQFRAGFSEAVKVTLLKSRSAFDSLEKNAAKISRREPGPSLDAIRTSAIFHLDHITKGGDPFEGLEARPLDFGHWSAHRLEAVTDFSLSHGHAVGIGVAIDAVYSSLEHGFEREDAERVLGILETLGLPIFHPALNDFDGVIRGLEEFRQHLGGRLTVTMLRGIGDPIEVHEIREASMRAAIDAVKARSESSPVSQASNRAA